MKTGLLPVSKLVLVRLCSFHRHRRRQISSNRLLPSRSGSFYLLRVKFIIARGNVYILINRAQLNPLKGRRFVICKLEHHNSLSSGQQKTESPIRRLHISLALDFFVPSAFQQTPQIFELKQQAINTSWKPCGVCAICKAYVPLTIGLLFRLNMERSVLSSPPPSPLPTPGFGGTSISLAALPFSLDRSSLPPSLRLSLPSCAEQNEFI